MGTNLARNNTLNVDIPYAYQGNICVPSQIGNAHRLSAIFIVLGVFNVDGDLQTQYTWQIASSIMPHALGPNISARLLWCSAHPAILHFINIYSKVLQHIWSGSPICVALNVDKIIRLATYNIALRLPMYMGFVCPFHVHLSQTNSPTISMLHVWNI